MERRILKAVPVLGLTLLLTGGAVTASAQQNRNRNRDNRNDDYSRNRDDNNRNRNRDDDYNRNRDDDYNRDDNYNRNGNYGNRNGGYYGSDIRSSVQRVKSLSRDFQRHLDSALDDSRYNGRNSEDRINDVAKDFREAASRLEDRFGDGRNSRNSYDGSNEARELLQLGTQIDRFMSRNRFESRVESEWDEISRHLSVIGNAYGYNFSSNRGYGNGSYGNNGRNGRNDDNNRNRDNQRNNRRNSRNGNGNNGRFPF